MTIIADGNGLRAWAKAFYRKSSMPPDELRIQSRALLDLVEALDRTNEIERLRAALKPFAAYADPRGHVPENTVISLASNMSPYHLTMGDCYAARDALK